MRRLSLLAVFPLLVLACAAPDAEHPAATDVTHGTDQAFYALATSFLTTQIQASEVLLERAEDPEVRDLAIALADHHRDANREVGRAAAAAGIAAPPEMLPADRAALDVLAGLAGADLERAWLELVISEHEQALPEFERENREGTVSELRIFAERTLPELRDHLQRARALAGRSTPG